MTVGDTFCHYRFHAFSKYTGFGVSGSYVTKDNSKTPAEVLSIAWRYDGLTVTALSKWTIKQIK